MAEQASSLATELGGVPVGAVRIARGLIDRLRCMLEEYLGDRVGFRGIDPIQGSECPQGGAVLVHLPPSAAGISEPEMTNLLKPLNAVFLAGVRKQLVNRKLDQILQVCKQRPRSCHQSHLTFAEVFAGIGGFRLGLQGLGCKCVMASEINPAALSIYANNFAGEELHGDIIGLYSHQLPDFDILTAGFPCQTFSNRGDQQGFADERGQLYLELQRLLLSKQPKGFIFENVVGLVLMEGGERSARIRGHKDVFKPGAILKHMLRTFSDCGYDVAWQVINARAWLPQQRERVYIVGTRRDLACPPIDLYNLDGEDGCGGTLRDIMEGADSSAVAHASLTEEQWSKIQSASSHPDHHRRLALDAQVPTLTASYHSVGNLTTKLVFSEADGSNRSIPRFLTLRECCRAMGFPDEFRIPSHEHDGHAAVAHCYKALGNAVCPPVIKAVGARLLSALDSAGAVS